MQSSKKIKHGAIEDYISESTQSSLNTKLSKTIDDVKNGNLTLNNNLILPNLAALPGSLSNVGIDENGIITNIPIETSTTGNVQIVATNKTGATIPKGTAVYINGAQGSKATIDLAIANTSIITAAALGITSAAIANNASGYVTINGEITNINTSSFSNGDQVYLSSTVLGGLTTTIPSSPNHVTFIGTVTNSHSTQGKILINIKYTAKIGELVDVSVFTPTDNQALTYETSSGLWKNKTIISGKEIKSSVNDIDYTVTDTNDHLVSFTALTTNRSVFLPPATISNQRVRIADESFTCSGLKKILIVPNGTDSISGGINSSINFPGGSALFESSGSGKWTTLSTTAIQLSAGVNTVPTITDNGNGTITIGDNGVYTLFANTDGSGRPKSYAIAGGTFTMVDGSLNYIFAKYDSTTSTSSIMTTTLDTDINSLSSTKILSVYRQGTILFTRDNDKLGLALSNKLQRNAEQTSNIRVNSGTVILSESATRIVNVSAGTAWIGGNEIPLAATSSSTANTMFFVTQTSPNVWDTTTFAPGGQYSNTQYNDPTIGLQTLSTNKYAVIFVFRSLGQGNKLAYVLGQGNYQLGDAQLAKRPTNLPGVITSQMIPVGRIIIQKGASVATQIDKISDESYAFSGVTDHNALSNLQTAQVGVTYGHITDTTQTISGDKAFTGSITTIPATTSSQVVVKSQLDGVAGINTHGIYKARITNSATGSLDIYENTIGSIVWTHTSTGILTGVLTGAFASAKVIMLVTGGTNNALTSINAARIDNDTIHIVGYINTTLSDTALNLASVFIEVYP